MPKNSQTEDYEHPVIREDGREQCVVCGEVFGGEKASLEVVHTTGPVVNADTGHVYDLVYESEAGTPLACPDCYKQLTAERHAEQNRSLGEFA